MATDFFEFQSVDSVYVEIGKRFVEEVLFQEALQEAIDSPIDFAAKATGKATGKKNCNPAKSHFCQTPNGKGSCVPLSKQCKYKATGTTAAAANAVGAATAKKAAKPKAAKQPKTPATAPQPTAAPAASDPVKVNQQELDSKRNDLINRFGQKAVEDAENNVQKVLDDADIFVRVRSADTLEKILDGGFKTSAEMGVMAHSVPHLRDDYQTARNRVEAKVLGYDEKSTPPGDRPIYGYLGGRDLNGRSHEDLDDYGSITVKLREETKDRATFTGSDSFKSGIASQIKNDGNPPPPNAASLVSSTRHGYDKGRLPGHYPAFYSDASDDGVQLRGAARAKSVDDLAPALAPTGKAYVEAQVHGGVKANDIAELHFSPRGASDRPSAKVAQFAKDNDVPLYVNGKRLSNDELDTIITPPADRRSQRLKDLDDAIAKGDLDTVFKLAEDLDREAQSVKLGPGELDNHLKLLYAEAGFDGKPRVGTKADLDAAVAAGHTTMVRGQETVRKGDTAYLDQFKNGDYFVGNGIYGNGTYVGHSGTFQGGQFVHGNSRADNKRAWNDVAQHGYLNPGSLNFRMTLDPSAKVVTQADLRGEILALQTRIDTWKAGEEQKIRAAGSTNQKGNRKSDLTKVQSEAARVQTAYSQNPGTTTKRRRTGMYGDWTEDRTLSYGGQSYKYTVRKDSDFISGKPSYVFVAADGTTSTHKTLKAANTAADQHIFMQIAAKNLGYAQIPNPGGASAATKRQLQDLDDRVTRITNTLFGDMGSGSSGRFATIRGYDAVALNTSYEPDSFMLLLNRSRVLVQDDPLSWKDGQRKGAGT